MNSVPETINQHAIDDDVPLEDSVSIAHLEENTAAQEIVLTEAEFEALDQAYTI